MTVELPYGKPFTVKTVERVQALLRRNVHAAVAISSYGRSELIVVVPFDVNPNEVEAFIRGFFLARTHYLR